MAHFDPAAMTRSCADHATHDDWIYDCTKMCPYKLPLNELIPLSKGIHYEILKSFKTTGPYTLIKQPSKKKIIVPDDVDKSRRSKLEACSRNL